MKPNLLVLVFLFCLSFSFAQKYGVNIASAYSINSFKSLHVEDYRIDHVDYNLKQKLFPNVSVRPYVRIHKKLQLYFGADLLKYEFKYGVYYSNNPLYAHPEWNYSRRLLFSEVHTPLMLKYEIIKFKEQYPLFIYVGAFARFLVWVKGRISYDSANYDLIPEENFNMSLIVRERKQRYTNVVIGLHQILPFNKYFYGFTDLQFKYMPSNIYDVGNPATVVQPLSILNKFSFHISLGIGFQYPDKEKQTDSDPARLSD